MFSRDENKMLFAGILFRESKTTCISQIYIFASRKQNAFRWYIFSREENKMHFAGIYFHQTKTEGKWGQGGGIDTRYLVRININ